MVKQLAGYSNGEPVWIPRPDIDHKVQAAFDSDRKWTIEISRSPGGGFNYEMTACGAGFEPTRAALGEIIGKLISTYLPKTDGDRP